MRSTPSRSRHSQRICEPVNRRGCTSVGVRTPGRGLVMAMIVLLLIKQKALVPQGTRAYLVVPPLSAATAAGGKVPGTKKPALQGREQSRGTTLGGSLRYRPDCRSPSPAPPWRCQLTTSRRHPLRHDIGCPLRRQPTLLV